MSDVLSYPVEDSASQEVLYVESVRMNDTRIESSSGSQLDQSALTATTHQSLILPRTTYVQKPEVGPKPEIVPKPSFLRQSPARKLPSATGFSPLQIMTSSLTSPFSNTADSNYRSVWSPRGGFSEAANNKTSPGTPGSTSSNSSCGSHKKGASPSPTSRIPVSSFRDNVELGLTLSQSLICDNQAKPIANNSSSIDVSATPLTSGSLSKLTAKATGTASMLRSTLRRMTKLAVGTSNQSNFENPPSHRYSSASPNRGGSPKLETVQGSTHVSRKSIASSASTSVSIINRSRSFKDVGNQSNSSGLLSRPSAHQVQTGSLQQRSNSMRRSMRQKDNSQQNQQINGHQSLRPSSSLQRSGTSGTLDREKMRRSNSAATSGVRKSREQHLRKSRGVQTLLTKDTLDEDGADENANSNVVEFTVYLPDLLGSGGGVDEGVEIVSVEPLEPIDIRRNRQLTLDNMRLNREIEKLKIQLNETDTVRRELKASKAKLEEEQKVRLKIEQQIDQHNEKVLLIARSMDNVEKEFVQRDQQIACLESTIAKRDAELKLSNNLIEGQKAEMEKAVALQRTLLMQYQEAQLESKELQEFLQAEKYTLAETLKDCESEMSALRTEISKRDEEIEKIEERCGHLVRIGEQRNQEIKTLQFELRGVEESAKNIILTQGAELSSAHAFLSELFTQIGCEIPRSKNIYTKSSQINVNEPVNEASQEGNYEEKISDMLLNDKSLQNLSEAIAKRKMSEDIFYNTSNDNSDHDGNCSLDTKLELLKTHIFKLLSDSKKSTPSSSSETNGSLDNGTPVSVNGNIGNILESNEELCDAKEDMVAKLLRHRKILMENCEEAEVEIKRVDDIYHDLVKHVVKVLDSLPVDAKTLPDLKDLKSYLENETTETISSVRPIKGSVSFQLS